MSSTNDILKRMDATKKAAPNTENSSQISYNSSLEPNKTTNHLSAQSSLQEILRNILNPGLIKRP